LVPDAQQGPDPAPQPGAGGPGAAVAPLGKFGRPRSRGAWPNTPTETSATGPSGTQGPAGSPPRRRRACSSLMSYGSNRCWTGPEPSGIRETPQLNTNSGPISPRPTARTWGGSVYPSGESATACSTARWPSPAVRVARPGLTPTQPGPVSPTSRPRRSLRSGTCGCCCCPSRRRPARTADRLGPGPAADPPLAGRRLHGHLGSAPTGPEIMQSPISAPARRGPRCQPHPDGSADL